MAGGRDLRTWIEYIQTVHYRSIDLSLDRVQEVMASLNLGQRPYQVISVAGTNGKGSCVALLEAALCSARLSVGSFTSPHLVRYNERIRINQKAVDDALICAAFERIEAHRGKTPLTYFEFSTLAALEIFQQTELDVAILEVGLGGRLDAVNCVDADVALISSIGLDHTDWLGNDLESIAIEKAGIFRPDKPAVCAQPYPPQSLIDAACERGSALLRLGIDFGYQKNGATWCWWITEENSHLWQGVTTNDDENFTDLPYPAIPGNIQLQNAAAVLMALNCLPFKSATTKQVLVHALKTCELPGRLQHIEGPPRQIFDVAHNRDAIRVLRQFLELDASGDKTYAVVAMLQDKPVSEMVKLLEHVIDVWYVATLENERGASAQYLHDCVLECDQGSEVYMHETVLGAYYAAMNSAKTQDRLVIFGSFFTVGAIMQSLDMRPYT